MVLFATISYPLTSCLNRYKSELRIFLFLLEKCQGLCIFMAMGLLDSILNIVVLLLAVLMSMMMTEI